MSRSAPPSHRSSSGTGISNAEALFARGKLDAALVAYREVVDRDPEHLEALRGLARVLQRVHDVPGAIAAFRRVLALAAHDWEAQNDLGAALMETGAWDEAQAAFESARAAAPHEPMLAVNLGTLAVRRGSAGDAVAVLSACLARHPDYAPAQAGLGFALRELGRHAEAAAALERALRIAPHDATVACGLSRVLLEGGRASEASVVARAYLRLRPGHAGALAAETLARIALGDTASVERLLDYERLIARVELTTPEGYPDVSAFNRELAAHVTSHHTLVRSPVSHATKDGLHSGSLLVSPRGPVAAFERALHAAVAAYLRALPGAPDHPFSTSRPRAAFFNVWGVVLERGGHQTPHIHPSAWLSGVYYPRVPAAISGGQGLALLPRSWQTRSRTAEETAGQRECSGEANAGWMGTGGDARPPEPTPRNRAFGTKSPIPAGDNESVALELEGSLEFGGVDRPFPGRFAQRTLCVRPREGLLVLFPSYFYHRTIPFEAGGTRVSIAFDVVPVR
jgi:Flp pilus assembly protein TadD